MEELRIQRPELPDNWLYEDWGNDIRIFTKEVALGCRANRWFECTNEEKEQWETQHDNEQLIG
jgi:hypothetical protein